jgi:hypothetical protein
MMRTPTQVCSVPVSHLLQCKTGTIASGVIGVIFRAT